MEAHEVISLLGLIPHREGGFFAETYRSPESITPGGLPARFIGGRSLSTAIYYMITEESCSTLHSVASDEIFHFYAGDPVIMLQLGPGGASRRVKLGPNLGKGERPQVVVSAGWWQGTMMAKGGSWALLGATVAPGFEYEDFKLGARAELQAGWPSEAALIEKLTR